MGAPMDHKKAAPPAAPFHSNSTSSNHQAGGILATYTSLIQQYLTVFQLDNAIFLAERCVAEYSHSHTGISEVVYLLALAHYRKQQPQRARQVLLRHPWKQPQQQQGMSSIGASMHFLAAQCSVDLQDYARAEVLLLENCKLQYKQIRAATSSATTTADTHSSSAVVAVVEPMDDWILSTTVRTVVLVVVVLLGTLVVHARTLPFDAIITF